MYLEAKQQTLVINSSLPDVVGVSGQEEKISGMVVIYWGREW